MAETPLGYNHVLWHLAPGELGNGRGTRSKRTHPEAAVQKFYPLMRHTGLEAETSEIADTLSKMEIVSCQE